MRCGHYFRERVLGIFVTITFEFISKYSLLIKYAPTLTVLKALMFHKILISRINRSNATTKSQKEKETCFNAPSQYRQPKIARLNKSCSLKSSLRVELVYMQYNISDS